jgi:hypothetical protein
MRDQVSAGSVAVLEGSRRVAGSARVRCLLSTLEMLPRRGWSDTRSGEEREMADKRVVLAIFASEAAADAAVASLKSTDLAEGDAIGVLALDASGQIKTDKVGTHSTGKGAGIGLVLGLLGPVGIGAGVVGGGLLGRLHHKGLGLSEADRDRIAAELTDGKAAVGVLADAKEAATITAHLTSLGGTLEEHPVSDEALAEAAGASSST